MNSLTKLKKINDYVGYTHCSLYKLVVHVWFTAVLVALLCPPQVAIAQASDLEQDSVDLYQALIDSSFRYGNLGKYSEAEQTLKRAIKLKPKHPLNTLLLNNLGGLQELQQKPREALLSYSAALELAPTETTTRANRARLFVSLGNLKAALTDYSLLVSMEPTNEVHRYQRAMTYMLTKEYDLAEADLNTIIDSNPESLKPRIGLALLKTQQAKYDEAERLYDYLLIRLPKSTEVYEGRARLYLARGMRGYAVRDINKAFELAGASASAPLYRLRAQIALAMGDNQAASQDLKTANKLDPTGKQGTP